MKMDLNGVWEMKRSDWSDWMDCNIPGSVNLDLLNAGLIEDPFYRENEASCTAQSSYDYEYQKNFIVSGDLLNNDSIFVKFNGLDSITNITLNGIKLASTNNMHRTYEFEVKKNLREGSNNLHIYFYSPIKYITDKNNKQPLWGVSSTISGYSHIRKAHHMFGWDWGPKLPDAGIWRTVSIQGYKKVRFEDIYISQHHENGQVTLDIKLAVERFKEEAGLEVQVTVFDASKVSVGFITKPIDKETIVTLTIDKPSLWWPNGYGNQALYTVETILKCGTNIIETDIKKIGLRTINLRREKDQWGESFEFQVNGKSIFAMGADYIPEDSVLPRGTLEKTEKLIKDCIEANFNCIRIWGGGVYPSDELFNLCDQYGLIVWQDFMFACAVYDLSEEFTKNIVEELKDNIKRIRHHASLGLWCGNNEMEWAFEEWGIAENKKWKMDYIHQYEKLIPDVLAKYDPNTAYWPCSPSSGGGFDNPNDPNRGDTHFWDVFNGLQPYKVFANHYFRFLSEFGIQSFPSRKTVESFTLPQDRNIFSSVMEYHNKRIDGHTGNIEIMHYIAQDLKYPKDFESVLYASQIVQAEGVKYCVEHLRRNRGRCMGVTYWQLNDCYPVASWSSIDYYGRWKALNYYAKRFYAPVLLSAYNNGTEVELHVINETLKEFKGTAKWRLIEQQSGLNSEGSLNFISSSLSAAKVTVLDFQDVLKIELLKRNTYFVYELYEDNEIVSSETLLFVPPKYFNFLKANIKVVAREVKDSFILNIISDAYAKGVELDLEKADAVFSINYFDLVPKQQVSIILKKERLSESLTLEELNKQLTVRSIFDIAN